MLGCSSYAAQAESDEEVMVILDFYRQVYEDLLAIPVVPGKKARALAFVALCSSLCRRRRRSLLVATTPPPLRRSCLPAAAVFRFARVWWFSLF